MTCEHVPLPALNRRQMLAMLGGSAALGVASLSPETSAAPLQTAATGGGLTFQRGAGIRTVLRDVAPETMTRATLFHEHLSFEWARVAP